MEIGLLLQYNLYRKRYEKNNIIYYYTIDCNHYTATVLMDLSKAFDFLLHDLLILKLESYGLSRSALNLMYIYLSERKQCSKVGVDFST